MNEWLTEHFVFQAHSKTAEKQGEEDEKEKPVFKALQKEEEDLKVIEMNWSQWNQNWIFFL